MKKFSKVSLAVALAIIMVVGTVFTGNSVKVSAATRKCYSIGTANTRVYSDPGLTKGYGWIYPTDEITVLLVTSRYSKVTYGIGGGRTKTGYIPTSAILLSTGGSTYTNKGNFSTYIRPGGKRYGTSTKGDSVMILGVSGNYTQIKYNVPGGYKYAFALTSDVNKYVKGGGVAAPANNGYQTSTVRITVNGQTVDTFNGVPAKYIPGTGNSNTGTYCCARYVSNYYKSIYGVTVSNMFTGRTPAASSGYFYMTSNPQVGDIGYQTNSSGSGHWFIIKSVNSDGSCCVIEQNWKWKSGGSTYCNVNRRVSYGATRGFKVFRWSKK